MSWIDRAHSSVNLLYFNNNNTPDYVFDYKLDCPYDRQYILRAMVKDIHKDFYFPIELEWTRDLVMKCHDNQSKNSIRHPYCYVTIRHGIHTAETEDEWHVDGFSQIITHLPEQNYIATNAYCTEWVSLPINFPTNFDPLRHNIQSYIDKEVTTNSPLVQITLPNTVSIFDPYIIHRRPISAYGKLRTFVRVTFVPIEICDDACYTANGKYNRTADTTRNTLTPY